MTQRFDMDDARSIVAAWSASDWNLRPTPDLLRLVRAALGVSQLQLARLLGVTRDAVAQWEAGRKPLSAGMLCLALRMLCIETFIRQL